MNEKLKKYLIRFGLAIVIIVVLFLLILLAGFLAVKYNLTNVVGDVDHNSYRYNIFPTTISSTSLYLNDKFLPFSPDKKITFEEKQKQKSLCQVQLIRRMFPENAAAIIDAYNSSKSSFVVDRMLLAIDLRLNNKSFSDQLIKCNDSNGLLLEDSVLSKNDLATSSDNVFVWLNSSEWDSIELAILKDEQIIKKAAEVAGINPRMLVSVLIVEQLRLYHTQREMFEKIFKPLSILANANKMAWGVMAIKEKTAIQIEGNLKDEKSVYYLGKDYEHILDFNSSEVDKERYDRLTNAKNHYYSYLYGALYLREVMKQWEDQGVLIGDRPEILATLFNIGFKNSRPKVNPEVGGSLIKIGENEYSFGSLAYEFYFSGKIIKEFPF